MVARLAEQELVTITRKEYNDLVEDSTWLRCLESAGVDNWSGYSFAQELRGEIDEEDD